MAFKSTLAEMLLQEIEKKADLTPKHRYYKTTDQQGRFRTDMIWIILKWFDDVGITLDLKV